MSEFKIGDVVWLKSGGPPMTISALKDKFCYCDWFINDKMEHGDFVYDILTTEDPDALPTGSRF